MGLGPFVPHPRQNPHRPTQTHDTRRMGWRRFNLLLPLCRGSSPTSHPSRHYCWYSRLFIALSKGKHFFISVKILQFMSTPLQQEKHSVLTTKQCASFACRSSPRIVALHVSSFQDCSSMMAVALRAVLYGLPGMGLNLGPPPFGLAISSKFQVD